MRFTKSILTYLQHARSQRPKAVRPSLEGLESRLLLYATNGGQWAYGTKITFSFMPDGTSVGGVGSSLISMLNAKYPTATWIQQFQLAAAVWEDVANINLYQQFPDQAEPEGFSGYQQGDPNVGDIRIGAVPLSSGLLAMCELPPPVISGTAAGDFFLNTNVSWQIGSGSGYDLETVAIHEFGHALGLADSLITSAVMYATYGGVKTALSSDDIAGIQSIWGARQPDMYNSGGNSNGVWTSAVNITSYLNRNNQIIMPILDLTSANQYEWFAINIPWWKNGTMAVQMQSSNFSELTPRLAVFQGSNGQQAISSSTGGALVEVDYPVSAGQTYLIRASAGLGGATDTGIFGLQVNIGLNPSSPFSPYNTTVASNWNPNSGGYVTNGISALGGSNTGSSTANTTQPQLFQLGNMTVWGEAMTTSGANLMSPSGAPIVLLAAPGSTKPAAITPTATVAATAMGVPATNSAPATTSNTASTTPASSLVTTASSGAAPPNPADYSQPSGSSSSSSPSVSVLQAVDRVLGSWKKSSLAFA
jgi:hypothetical protein